MPANVPAIEIMLPTHFVRVTRVELRQRGGPQVVALMPGAGTSIVETLPAALAPNALYDVVLESDCQEPATGGTEELPRWDPCLGSMPSDEAGAGWQPATTAPPYVIRTTDAAPIPASLLADEAIALRAEGDTVVMTPVLRADVEPFRPITNVSMSVVAGTSASSRSGFGGPLPTATFACNAAPVCREALRPGVAYVELSARMLGKQPDTEGTALCVRVACGAQPKLETLPLTDCAFLSAAPDAGPDAAQQQDLSGLDSGMVKKEGCACAVGESPSPAGVVATLAGVLALMLRRRRRSGA